MSAARLNARGAGSARQLARTKIEHNAFFIDEMTLENTPLTLLLIRLDWVRRSIRPPARGNHEFVDRFRISPEVRMQHHGRKR